MIVPLGRFTCPAKYERTKSLSAYKLRCALGYWFALQEAPDDYIRAYGQQYLYFSSLLANNGLLVDGYDAYEEETRERGGASDSFKTIVTMTYTCKFGVRYRAELFCGVPPEAAEVNQWAPFFCPYAEPPFPANEADWLPAYFQYKTEIFSPLDVMTTKTIIRTKMVTDTDDYKPFPSKDEICAKEFQEWRVDPDINWPKVNYAFLQQWVESLPPTHKEFNLEIPCCKKMTVPAVAPPDDPIDREDKEKVPDLGFPFAAATISTATNTVGYGSSSATAEASLTVSGTNSVPLIAPMSNYGESDEYRSAGPQGLLVPPTAPVEASSVLSAPDAYANPD